MAEYIVNLEHHVGTTDNRVGTLVERIHTLEDTLSSMRLVIDDRINVDGDSFTLSALPAQDSDIDVTLLDLINGELCEVGKPESSDVTIDYDTGICSFANNDFDGKKVKAIFMSSGV